MGEARRRKLRQAKEEMPVPDLDPIVAPAVNQPAASFMEQPVVPVSPSVLRILDLSSPHLDEQRKRYRLPLGFVVSVEVDNVKT